MERNFLDPDRLCSIDGCQRNRLARGLCSKHWQTWKRNGDPTKLQIRTEPRGYINGGIGYIELTQGKIAKVSPEDFPSLMENIWSFHGEYAHAAINGKKVYMHKIIQAATCGYEVDHINGDKLDNRRENLRSVTRSNNNANSKLRSGKTSRYRGVHWSKRQRKWAASIGVNRKTIYLGYFYKEKEAAKAYDVKALEFFGNHASPNFPCKN